MATQTFSLALDRFAKKVGNRGRTVLQKISLEIDRGLVLTTRVRTGRARGGWNVGINNVNLAEPQEDKTGQLTLSENKGNIKLARLGDTVYLSNNVEYIKHLNDGTNKMTGDFMVEKTLQRFPQIVRTSTDAAKSENP